MSHLSVYRLLLRVYPASFRTDYQLELEQIFKDRLAEAESTTGLVAYWCTVAADTLRSAAAIHLDILRQDVAYATKSFQRAIGFTLAAVSVAGLGVGATTAVFSLADRVLLRPLPFDRPHELVRLWEHTPGYRRMELSPANYRDWKRMSSVFARIGVHNDVSVNLFDAVEPRRLDGAELSVEVFPMLGVSPRLGRWFEPSDYGAASPPVVVLGHSVWQSAFAASADVVGREVLLNDVTHEVVGVMPPGFYFPDRRTSLWTAKRFVPEDFEDRSDHYLKAIARLGDGHSLESARSELGVITERLAYDYPDSNERSGATVVRLRDEVSPQARYLLAALVGAVGCLLLIACTNLANLLLVRGMARRRELAVRAALGAGRERLRRQVLTESLVLAAIGGLVGILVANLMLPLLVRMIPASLPVAAPVVLEGRILGFALGLTVLVGLFFGLVPALTLGGAKPSLLRERRTTAAHGRARSVMVVAQIAISIVLIVSSGLLTRAMWRVQSVDPGFRADGVLTLRTPLPMNRYGETARRAEFYRRVLSKVQELPGVTHAAYTSFLPFVMRGGIWPVRVDGVDDPAAPPKTASLRFVTPGFFSSLDIALESGRDVRETDIDQPPFIAVVSRSFVNRYWTSGEEPIGRSFEFAFRERVIVGVVEDIRVRGLERPSEPQVYLPYQQVPDGGLVFYAPKDLVVRANANPEQLVPAVRDIVRGVDPSLPISDVRLLSDIVGGETAPRRSQIKVLGAFTAISMILAGVGLYSLLSYIVSERSSEIGLRMALGARRRQILLSVLRDGLTLAMVGGASGLLVAYIAGRGLQAVLFGVPAGDPATYLLAVAIALVVTLVGGLFPAARAARIDPRRALDLQ